jgi:2-aminophenol/2-amino-5-chlorophenol 1,6-dioxygenase alpha subunit
LIEKVYLVPGQPHILLAPDRNEGWRQLNAAYKKIGEEIAASGAELLLVYSTQWFSVIGHLMQVDPNPEWVLVDQNWYELGEMPYSFRIDSEFGKLYCAAAKAYGMQASTVNYHGFPIDTGTVVALKLLNPDNAIPASIVSCNIYAEREETRLLGRAARETIDSYGKQTIVVVVSNLSNRYEVAEIDPAHDRISSQKDDEWNRKIVEMLGEGRLEDVAQVAREFGREANADMGFKAIWWLASLAGEHNKYDGKVHAYAPVWGTGCALVELTPNPQKEIDWEKEFDEANPVGAAEEGTGLETHNVLAEGPRVHEASEMSSHEDVPPRPEWEVNAIDAGAHTSPAVNSMGAASRPSSGAEPALSGREGRHPLPGGEGIVITDRAPKPVGPYPHARRVGDFLFLSGIGPRQPGTGEIPGVVRDAAGSVIDHDIEVQTRACIENIRVILDEAGSSLDKVLDVTVYLTDMARDFETFNKVYGEYFAHVQPTRTTVGVDSLPTPIAVELKVIASI